MFKSKSKPSPAIHLGIALGLLAFVSPSWAQTGSKLGPHHILTYTNPAASINAAGPAIIKVLDLDGTMFSTLQDAKTANPSCVSVVRIYTTTTYSFSQDPTLAAQDFWNNVLSGPLNALTPAQKALIDYVEGPNEPSYSSVSECQWHSDFWLELAPLIANAGFKPCAYSIAVGNPGGNQTEMLARIEALTPALYLCKSLGGGWSYHSYTIPYTTDINQEIYYSLRYRQYYDYFATNHPTLVDLPLLLTEGGVDIGGGPSTDGWQARGTAQDFENWLAWFDDRMREDPYVIGCTLFQSGSGGWPSFDIDPVAPWIVNRINTTPGGPPSAPLGVVASAGDGQVNVSWTASSGATHYDVKRASTTGGPYSVIANDITTTSHLDTGVTNGNTYYYVVSAENGSGDSGNSSEVSATPQVSTNKVTNGDFSNGLTGWSVWTERGSLNETASGGVLQVSSTDHNGGIYQQFSTGGIGTAIDISGWWASNPTVASYQWAEVLVINGSRTPVNGQDINDGQSDVEMIYKNDTWTSTGGWSGNMDQTAPVVNNGSFIAADTVATIILKSGNAQGLNSGTQFDDILVEEGTPPPPAIALNPSTLSPSADEGTSPANDSFTVQNSGGGTLYYSITDNVGWLSVSPSSGDSTGEQDTISVQYSTSGLSAGTHNATITVSDSGASNNPQTIAVTLTINSTGGVVVSEDFNSMPGWDSTYDAVWGGSANWNILGGGQSGNALEGYRSNQGSSVRVEVYNLTANTDYTISLYIKQGSYGGSYWTETAFRLGNHSGSDFDNNAGAWTMIKKFDNGGANGNGNSWTQYSVNFNSGSDTQISVGYKLGSSGGAGPTVQWDTLRIEE